jgi:hypothetical protein
MRNVKTRVIHVITGATGTITKSFRKYLGNIPGRYEIKELQNSHIVYSTHTSQSTNVKAQNVYRRKEHYLYHTL